MRLISEEDLLRRLEEAMSRYKDSDEKDFIDQAILIGLERAKMEVILSPTEGRK